LIPDLPGKLTRLFQDRAAIFRISVIAEIGAFIDEALTPRVHQYGEGIGMFLKLIADR
jgi:hypothetical protein